MDRPLSLIGLCFLCALVLQGCAGVPDQSAPRAVAVWNLENLSIGDTSRPDLGELLSSEIMQTIKDRGEMQVVEREKLVTVMEELSLGSSNLADDSAKLKVGKMIGAREMIFGGYMVVGPTVRIDIRRVDVETGRIISSAGRTAGANDLPAWLDAVRGLAAEVYGKR